MVIPTVGKGNVGDQAMLDSYLTNVACPVTVILVNEDSHGIRTRDDCRVVVLPHLFSPVPWRRLPALMQFVRMLGDHESLSVIGADIMDGSYERREAILRYALLELANLRGLSTRVLGFSWSGCASPSVLSALRATQPATRLIVRDPLSAERLRADYPEVVPQNGADMVFLLGETEEYVQVKRWIEERERDLAPIVLFNASGLLEARLSLASDYRDIITGLRGVGASVLLLPHVIRDGDDDREVCRELYRHLPGGTDLMIVDDLLSPGQVAWLAEKSAAVFTGRMHLSILALGRHVPAVVLSTQGKVEGMLGYFGLEHLAVAPNRGIAADCLELLVELIRHPVTDAIEARLPFVKQLAAANFVGLVDR